MNNEILGALLKNAAYIKDYDYVIDVLEYAMNENIKPTSKFIEILSKFRTSRFYALQSNPNDPEHIENEKFYAVYRKWRAQMGLAGLSRDDAIKAANVHPWKQLEEGEGDGIEIVKNKTTRRTWKIQRTLHKLTPTRIDRLQNENIETDGKVDTIEDK